MSFWKAGDGHFLRVVAGSVLQLLMEADVEGLIGAGRQDRADRLNWRNGFRDRTLDTRLGSLSLKISELRPAATSRPLLEARKTTKRNHPGRLDRRVVYASGRRDRAGDGIFPHLEEPGLETVQGNDERVKPSSNGRLNGENVQASPLGL
jgi:hypothetical protein